MVRFYDEWRSNPDLWEGLVSMSIWESPQGQIAGKWVKNRFGAPVTDTLDNWGSRTPICHNDIGSRVISAVKSDYDCVNRLHLAEYWPGGDLLRDREQGNFMAVLTLKKRERIRRASGRSYCGCKLAKGQTR